MLLKQSLGGKCFTSVVIAASTKDSEMHNETIASIKFGSLCAKVATRKQSMKSMSNDDLKNELWAELQIFQLEINQIEKSGGSGGLIKDFPKSLTAIIFKQLGEISKA